MSFFDSRIKLDIFSPNTSNPIAYSQVRTVSNELEYINIKSFDIPGDAYGLVDASLDVSESLVSYRINERYYSTFATAAFNGYVISDYGNNLRPIVDVRIVAGTNTLNLPTSRVSFTADSISVNVSGLSFSRGDGVTLDVAFGYFGGAAADSLIGTNARDWLYGAAGADLINGGSSDDRLYGGDGGDVLYGGNGVDLINGGQGVDRLYGGAGNDLFVWSAVTDTGAVATACDIILDFARGDRIDLRAIDANTGLTGDQAFVLDAGGAFLSGEIKFVKSGADILVYGNNDADADADFAILIKNAPTLSAADFML